MVDPTTIIRVNESVRVSVSVGGGSSWPYPNVELAYVRRSVLTESLESKAASLRS